MWNGESSVNVWFLRFQMRRSVSRSLGPPQYGIVLRRGTKRASSCCQLCSVDAGAMTRNGPQMPCTSAKYARSEIDWIVLPRPISSARIPLMPCS